MSGRRVLVTGASGTIGAEVTAKLSRSGDTVLAAIHHNQTLVRNNRKSIPLRSGRVEGVRVDIARPRLGLSKSDYARLQASTDLIVHSAAVTEFGRASELYRDVNEKGTEHVIRFSERSGGPPIPLVHVSTAYVCGNRHGSILEQELDVGQSFANPYEQSKFCAECLVRDAATRGNSTVILRPSIVVGSSRIGATREFKNAYTLLKVLVEGRLHAVPANYDAILDLVPLDYVATMTLAVTQKFEQATGTTLHLLGRSPITLRECGEVLAEYPPFAVPRFVPPQSFDATRLSPIEHGYYERVVKLFEPYLTRHLRFSGEEAQRFASIQRPCTKTMLRRMLDYSLSCGYLGAPTRPIEAVLQTLSAVRDPLS